MINPFKALKTNNTLSRQLKEEKAKTENFKKACHTLLSTSTAEIVVEKLLNKPITWFDPNTLDNEKQIEYYEEAQAILRSPVFKNEKEAYVLDLMKYIATNSKDHRETEALRHSINGVQTLFERIKKVKNPRENTKEATDPYNPI